VSASLPLPAWVLARRAAAHTFRCHSGESMLPSLIAQPALPAPQSDLILRQVALIGNHGVLHDLRYHDRRRRPCRLVRVLAIAVLLSFFCSMRLALPIVILAVRLAASWWALPIGHDRILQLRRSSVTLLRSAS